MPVLLHSLGDNPAADRRAAVPDPLQSDPQVVQRLCEIIGSAQRAVLHGPGEKQDRAGRIVSGQIADPTMKINGPPIHY